MQVNGKAVYLGTQKQSIRPEDRYSNTPSQLSTALVPGPIIRENAAPRQTSLGEFVKETLVVGRSACRRENIISGKYY